MALSLHGTSGSRSVLAIGALRSTPQAHKHLRNVEAPPPIGRSRAARTLMGTADTAVASERSAPACALDALVRSRSSETFWVAERYRDGQGVGGWDRVLGGTIPFPCLAAARRSAQPSSTPPARFTG
jgi:hypothetical protein